jgi:F-box-like
MELLDLPLEILSEIFSHIMMPKHLASLCLVNNAFQMFAVCELYKEVSITMRLTTGKKSRFEYP